jgi:hypothetical protein
LAARVLATPSLALVAVINESSVDATRRVEVDGYPLDVTVPAGRAELLLVDRRTGEIRLRLSDQ